MLDCVKDGSNYTGADKAATAMESLTTTERDLIELYRRMSARDQAHWQRVAQALALFADEAEMT
jgi:hypothetical protein